MKGVRWLGAVAVVALVLAGCETDEPTSPPRTGPVQSAANDVRVFIDHLEAVHPNPWHDFSETRFEHEAARVMRQIDALSRDERTVALMRLTALLGTRDGHTGVFPLDPTHDTTLHLYPLRLYEFRDGFFVVDSIGMPELVGARVVAIAARPIEQVATAVRPLVPADNELSRKPACRST